MDPYLLLAARLNYLTPDLAHLRRPRRRLVRRRHGESVLYELVNDWRDDRCIGSDAQHLASNRSRSSHHGV